MKQQDLKGRRCHDGWVYYVRSRCRICTAFFHVYIYWNVITSVANVGLGVIPIRLAGNIVAGVTNVHRAGNWVYCFVYLYIVYWSDPGETTWKLSVGSKHCVLTVLYSQVLYFLIDHGRFTIDTRFRCPGSDVGQKLSTPISLWKKIDVKWRWREQGWERLVHT